MDQSVLLILIASASGLLALFAKLCYSSRCTHIKACGMDITRDPSNEPPVHFGNSTPHIHSQNPNQNNIV